MLRVTTCMQVVPDAWHVINDQDMVAKAPKVSRSV